MWPARNLRKPYAGLAYDTNGAPYTLTYDGTKYYYITNVQGDVMRLIDTSGNTAATYSYDPFGKVLSASGSMAEINPIRYRGYCYDTETGFYYLQSRYYDPALCRFINADAFTSTGQGVLGYNMFAYCCNCPVFFSDSKGYAAKACLSSDLMGKKKETPDDVNGRLVNGQGEQDWSDYPVGFGTYRYNGCGIIALYNAMQLLGRSVSLGDVNRALFWEYMLAGFGLLGLTPEALCRYLDAQNVRYESFYSASMLERFIDEVSIFILYLANDPSDFFQGFHYATVQYTNGQYVVYNRYTKELEPQTRDSISGIIEGGAFVYAVQVFL